jgi:hypothetical protein
MLSRICSTAWGFMMIAAPAWAVPLTPGGFVDLNGTTSFARPELAGVVIEDVLRPFSVDLGGGVVVSGVVQDRVVRENVAGTLDFYYKITNSPTSQGSIDFVVREKFTGFPTDVDWRIDGLGTVNPNQAVRTADGEEVLFDFLAANLLDPGEESKLFFIKTNATSYNAHGLGSIAVGAPGSMGQTITIPTFQPVVPSVLTPFVGNPTSNSADWTNYVRGAGGAVVSHLDFETHPNGPLQNDFYLASDGVTLSQVEWGTVQTGSGSAEGSNAEPLSPGEGPLGSATYVTSGGPYQMTVSFDEPVMGAGFMFADYFNAQGDNTNTIEAFSGPDGTGTSLGQFPAVALNFESNNLYFMGLADAANTIGSVVLSGPRLHGDSVYLDKILFARLGDPPLLAGDYNGDGKVDTADYVVWRNGLGSTYTAADYDLWRSNFGQTAGNGVAASSGISSVGVPEPAAPMMLLAGMLAILLRRRAVLLISIRSHTNHRL